MPWYTEPIEYGGEIDHDYLEDCVYIDDDNCYSSDDDDSKVTDDMRKELSFKYILSIRLKK